MNYKELKSILYSSYDSILIAMSTDRKTVVKDFGIIHGNPGDSEKYLYHICKVMMYGGLHNGEYDNKWAKEIFTFLSEVQSYTFKGSHKRPGIPFLLEDFFLLRLDNPISIENVFNVIEKYAIRKDNYKESDRKKIDYNKATKEYENFSRKCAAKISKGNLTLDDVREFIKPLFSL